MTEEIIIDGVDVAGCCLYLKDNGKCLRLLTDNEPETECNAICDYGCLYRKEQLIRLEQERDEIQERILTLADTYQETRNTCKRLEQENKELKEQLLEGKILDEHIESLSREDIYRSALEEIKSMVDKFDYWNSNLPKASEIIDEVKDKINEVLE